MDMSEIPDNSIHMMVTSPPYFNAPFDYKGLFKSYDQYLGVLRRVSKEIFRVLANGRIAVLNIDDAGETDLDQFAGSGTTMKIGG